MNYFLVALFQLIQSILKVYEIKWSYENQVTKLTTLSFIMSGVWIMATAIGVSAVLDGDWIMMVVYVIFGGIGKVLAIRVFGQNKYRSTLFKRITNKNE